MSGTAYDLAISKYITDRYNAPDNIGGKKLRAKVADITNNPVSHKKRKMLNSIAALAKREGKDAAQIALALVKKDLPTLHKYILSKGKIPLKNVAEAAVQAHQLRAKDIQKIAKHLDVPGKDAETILEEAEAELLKDNNGDGDEYLGALAGAIGEVAQKGLAKLAEKKKDKNGLFAKIVKAANADVNGEASPAPNESKPDETPHGIGGFFNSLFDRIKGEEKKKEIKKMLPMIIIGLLVFGFLVFYIARATKK